MLLSSVTFLFFFLPVILAITLFPGNRWRDATLLLASLVFYAWGGLRGIPVLVFSIAWNAVLGRWLEAPSGESRGFFPALSDRGRKALLALGIAVNLGILVFYKYVDFLLDAAGAVTGGAGASAPAARRGGFVPLGISFTTFHAITYLVDIYRKDASAARGVVSVSLYFAFFPKLLAGPIFPWRHAAGQFTAWRRVKAEGFLSGVERFIIGLGKKLLLSSPVGQVADEVFAIPAAHLPAEVAWFGILCYSLQIYLDFSGYTDMAVGLGKMFGFRIPENFNYPYIADSIRDFWRRWHISLSSWFRDYLYIPLGGNRCSKARQALNLVTVFFLCGLWHGASWTFVIWGLWHGFFLVLERTPFGRLLDRLGRPLRILYAQLAVVVGWVFFRSEDLPEAMRYLKAMAGLNAGASGAYHVSLYATGEVLTFLVLGLLVSIPTAAWCRGLLSNSPAPNGDAMPLAGTMRYVYALFLCGVFLLACMSLAGGTHNPFIYQQF